MEDIHKSQPLVTVGICTFNRASGLKRTLDCIISQTYSNLEIIVSQDYNTDLDLSEIVASYKDERVTFYGQQKRLRMYGNLRFVLTKAQGQYFMWAADDDWWAPEFIAEIISLLTEYPSMVAGFCDFIEVYENGDRVKYYPDHLPLLLELTPPDRVVRAKKFINQFEALGKANLFYSVFKTEILRSEIVLDLLEQGDLPNDMLINLSVLLKGNIVIAPSLLRTCTVDNVKSYDEVKHTEKLIDLFFMIIFTGRMKALYKKWNNYLFTHFLVVSKSDMNAFEKLTLYFTIVRKIILFYYDLVINNLRLRGYDVFSRIRRKYSLS